VGRNWKLLVNLRWVATIFVLIVGKDSFSA
jgi:hypothetical protein